MISRRTVLSLAASAAFAKRAPWTLGANTAIDELAKVLDAEIPDSAKELVLGGNLRRLYARALAAKGYAA